MLLLLQLFSSRERHLLLLLLRLLRLLKLLRQLRLRQRVCAARHLVAQLDHRVHEASHLGGGGWLEGWLATIATLKVRVRVTEWNELGDR